MSTTTKHDPKATRAAIRAQTQHLLDALSGLGAAPSLAADFGTSWHAGWYDARLADRLSELRVAATAMIRGIDAADADAKEVQP